MKIALLVPGFSAHERDWCIPALLDYVRVLAASAEVHVYALRWPERSGSYPVFGARVHALGGREHPGLRTPALAPERSAGASVAGLWARAARAIAAEHRRAPFDLLHAFWADEPGWVAAAVGGWVGLPVVISLAGGELAGLRPIGYGAQLLPGRTALIRWGLRRAARVTAGSDYLLRLAREHLPRAAWGRLVRAPLGVDTLRFAPAAPARPAGARVLNVGALYPVKGHAVLLRALARAPSLTLQIVGEGPLRPELQALATRLGVADRVHFAGAVPHERMCQAYHGADLFVQASWHEAQGMALLEGLACGLPALGTAVGCLPEVASGVRPGDAVGLGDALRAWGAAPPQPATLPAEFSLPRAAARFIELYNQCSGER